jgi:hypothetical protein
MRAWTPQSSVLEPDGGAAQAAAVVGYGPHQNHRQRSLGHAAFGDQVLGIAVVSFEFVYRRSQDGMPNYRSLRMPLQWRGT